MNISAFVCTILKSKISTHTHCIISISKYILTGSVTAVFLDLPIYKFKLETK